MIENILIRKQTPLTGKYLYKFDAKSNKYFIATVAYLGKSDTEWSECDEAKKAEFELHNKEQDRLREEARKNKK